MPYDGIDSLNKFDIIFKFRIVYWFRAFNLKTAETVQVDIEPTDIEDSQPSCSLSRNADNIVCTWNLHCKSV